ncbi:unnamed protein product [Mytilus edulis]|uniref:Uncharacterized protein n=1 Tax=Mytilus edulis TaxID=6550 RepID=A0A8S3QL40_MYTED|nr:unnamed protein product [Mytilus edulis]
MKLEIIWNDGIGGFNSFVSALKCIGSYQTLLDRIVGTQDDANINLDALDIEVEEGLQIAIEEVCDDFDLDFKNESTKAYIKERFEQPDTVYINRTGEHYHLFHQKVLEIMARLSCAAGHRDIVETLLTKSGCNVSKADDLEQTPLFVASMYGRADIVKILLEHHAKIEQCDIRGYTPLFAATINGTSQHGKVIKTLLDNNANISHCDNTGRTALLIACEKGFDKVNKNINQSK